MLLDVELDVRRIVDLSLKLYCVKSLSIKFVFFNDFLHKSSELFIIPFERNILKSQVV